MSRSCEDDHSSHNSDNSQHRPYKSLDLMFRRLVLLARHKVEAELEKAQASRFSFSDVHSLETLKPVSARFDPKLVTDKAYFEFELAHASQTEWPPMMVEAYLCKDESVVLCKLQDPGRSMLFPAFRHKHLQLESVYATGKAFKMTLATNTGTRIVLGCSEIEQFEFWKGQFEMLFPKKQALVVQTQTPDLTTMDTETVEKSLSFTSTQDDILKDSHLGLNILSPARSEPSIEQLNDTDPAETSLELPPSMRFSSGSSKYSTESPQLDNLESSALSFADEPEFRDYMALGGLGLNDHHAAFVANAERDDFKPDSKRASARARASIVLEKQVDDTSSRYSDSDKAEYDEVEYDSEFSDNDFEMQNGQGVTFEDVHVQPGATATATTVAAKRRTLYIDSAEMSACESEIEEEEQTQELEESVLSPVQEIPAVLETGENHSIESDLEDQDGESVVSVPEESAIMHPALVDQEPARCALPHKSSSSSIRALFRKKSSANVQELAQPTTETTHRPKLKPSSLARKSSTERLRAFFSSGRKKSSDALRQANTPSLSSPNLATPAQFEADGGDEGDGGPRTLGVRQARSDMDIRPNTRSTPETPAPAPSKTLKHKPSSSQRLASAFRSLGAKFKKSNPSSGSNHAGRTAEPEDEPERALDMAPEELACTAAHHDDRDLFSRTANAPGAGAGEYRSISHATGPPAPASDPQHQQRARMARAQKVLSKISEEVFFDGAGTDQLGAADRDAVPVPQAITQSPLPPTNEHHHNMHHVTVVGEEEIEFGAPLDDDDCSSPPPHHSNSQSNHRPLERETSAETISNMITNSRSFASSIGTAVDADAPTNDTVKLAPAKQRPPVSRTSSESTLAENRDHHHLLPFRKVGVLRTQAMVSKWQGMAWTKVCGFALNVEVFVTTTGGLLRCMVPSRSGHPRLNSITEVDENEDDDTSVPMETAALLELTLLNGKTQLSRRTVLDVHVRQPGDTTYLFRLKSSQGADEFFNTLEASTQDLARQVLLYNGDDTTPWGYGSEKTSVPSMSSSNSSTNSGSAGPWNARPSMTSYNSNERIRTQCSSQGMKTFLPPLLSTRNGSSGSLGSNNSSSNNSPVSSTRPSLFSAGFENKSSPDIMVGAGSYTDPELLLLNNLRCHLFKHGSGGQWLDVGLARIRVYSVPQQGDWRRVMLLKSATSEIIFDARLPRTCFNPAGNIGLSVSTPHGLADDPLFMLRFRGNKEAAYVSDLLT